MKGWDIRLGDKAGFDNRVGSKPPSKLGNAQRNQGSEERSRAHEDCRV